MRNRRILFVWFCALLGVYLYIPFVQASNLTVLVEHFPPWSVVEPGRVSGINVEIVETIASRLDLTVDYVPCPWKRCLKMMENGSGDAMTSLLKRPEREVYMVYIEPPYKTRSTKAFYVANGKAKLIQKYADLYPLEIGTTSGAKYFEPFDNDPKINKAVVTTDLQNLRKLSLGRLDAFIGTESNIDYLIWKEGFQGTVEKAHFKYDGRVEVYMAISRKSPYAGQVTQFNQAMRQAVEEGTIDAIIRSYFKTLER